MDNDNNNVENKPETNNINPENESTTSTTETPATTNAAETLAEPVIDNEVSEEIIIGETKTSTDSDKVIDTEVIAETTETPTETTEEIVIEETEISNDPGEAVIDNIEKSAKTPSSNSTTPTMPAEPVVSVEQPKKKTGVVIAILSILLVLSLGGCAAALLLLGNKNKEEDIAKDNESSKEEASPYQLKDGSLSDFDLAFLKLENKEENKLYSPLSIKYALGMLEEAAAGETKTQITNVIGSYTPKTYLNSENMSFANALFIRDTFQNAIKSSYTASLTNKFKADMISDSFTTPNAINQWVSDKTFGLVDNIYNDISDFDFILANALAIDMEWKNKIRDNYNIYAVKYPHIEYFKYIFQLMDESDYHKLDFDSGADKITAKSIEIGAVANKYDIVKELGEDNIRKTVGDEYKEWLATGDATYCDLEPDVEKYLDKYIEEINQGYKQISSSTDFLFYDDDDVKMFAKDLKEYNGTTLQYVGIMPKEKTLENFIKDTDAVDIGTRIRLLEPIELDSFKDGVVTEIFGYIPVFNFDYELNFMSDLKELGISDVFDSSKADLSNMTTAEGAHISDAKHKANIDFSNEGIKAAATTIFGGGGGGGSRCFDHLYNIPVEKIDLTFDNPYLFLIRDKDTGEVWFTGTVYQPTEMQ